MSVRQMTSGFTQFLSRRWLLLFGLLFGLYIGLPFLAPALMALGLPRLAQPIYWLYSFQCHQMPQRSFFLFGPQASYSLAEIQAAWQPTSNPLLLRQFIGNPEMGWKVAWSDRMVAMYAGLWLSGLFWRTLHGRIGKLPLWALVLFLLPMAVDGLSHFVSDLYGIGQGFRDTNLWLAALTGNSLPAAFYAGDALGSFNSWMRLLSGVLFGLGIAWYGFPYVAAAFEDAARPDPNPVAPRLPLRPEVEARFQEEN